MSTLFPRHLLTIVGLTFVLSTAQAAPAFSAVEQGNYAVDPNHTQIVFSVLHLGFTNYSGFFSNASGTLALDPVQPEASRLSISIPVGSILTPSTKLNGLMSPTTPKRNLFPPKSRPPEQTRLILQGSSHFMV